VEPLGVELGEGLFWILVLGIVLDINLMLGIVLKVS